MHRVLFRRAALLATLLAASLGRVWAEDEVAPAPDQGPRYAAAFAEIVGTHVLVNVFDRFVLGAEWAKTDLSSISRNLSSPWVFDDDSFSVNEIAHPYNGSWYFAACRSNGLGFWGSALGTAFGSATWELFGETEAPSINDIVSTTMGGIILGEISHRLYEKARIGGSALRLVASPMDSLNEALFDDEGESVDIPSRFALSLEAGMSFPNLQMADARGLEPGMAEPMGLIGESLSYGNPFESQASEPFSRFEQRLRLSLSPTFYEVSFFSNGSLWAVPLVDEPASKLSAGISLHYDFIFSSLVDLSANSVGLSLTSAQRLGGGFIFSGELHANAVAMSTNENLFLRDRPIGAGPDAVPRNYDFGLGEGAKLYLLLSQPRLGSLRLEDEIYGLHAIPAAQEDDSGFDYALVGMLELAYERMASAHLSLGLAYRLYHKDAFYRAFANVHEALQTVTLYVRIL